MIDWILVRHFEILGALLRGLEGPRSVTQVPGRTSYQGTRTGPLG